MNREEILTAAHACVCGEREQDYGSPENSFAAIAAYWQDYLEMSHCITLEPDSRQITLTLTPADVANMMCLFKLARLTSGTATADSYVDLAGYAACGGEIATKDPAAPEAVNKPNIDWGFQCSRCRLLIPHKLTRSTPCYKGKPICQRCKQALLSLGEYVEEATQEAEEHESD